MKVFSRQLFVLVFMCLVMVTSCFGEDCGNAEVRISVKSGDEGELSVEDQMEMAGCEIEAAMKMAQAETERAMLEVQKAMQEAETAMAEAGNTQNEATIALKVRPWWSSAGYGTKEVWVIPNVRSKNKMKTYELALIREDLRVMSRILDKKLGPVGAKGGGIGMMPGMMDPMLAGTILARKDSGIQGIYIEGYGAVFLITVDYPLSPEKEVKPEEKEEPETDPVWEQARRELSEEGSRELRRKVTRTNLECKYDDGRVETLKANLVDSLRHAVNIRAMTGMVVFSVRENYEITLKQSRPKTPKKLDDLSLPRTAATPKWTAPTEVDIERPTVLTVMVKKMELDDAAERNLLEEFLNNVRISEY